MGGIALSHVVVLVRDLDEAVAQLALLGLDFGEPIDTTMSGERLRSRFEPLGLEVVTPLDDDGPMAAYLDDHGPGLYGLGLRVPDVDAAREDLAARGIDPISGFTTDTLAEAYYHPSDFAGVLTILIEYPPSLSLEEATRREAERE